MTIPLDKMVTTRYGREQSLLFYDVTNYSWEIDTEDEMDPDSDEERQFLRKRGYPQEHRPEPIVQMGRLMDSEGLPMDFTLFDGNTNDLTELEISSSFTYGVRMNQSIRSAVPSGQLFPYKRPLH